MTTIKKQPLSDQKTKRVTVARRWLLRDAKARFSELVRLARKEGPQHVTLHGRDEVVVLTVEEFRRLKGDKNGASLLAAMQAAPAALGDFTPRATPMPVRDVNL